MNEIYIYHHLGLGDHIICNGIVREYAKTYDKVYVFCKVHNYDSVSFMYRDLKNVSIIMGDDTYANNFLQDKYNVRYVGFTPEYNRQDGCSFDEKFYKVADIGFNKRWDSFKVERDTIKENELIANLNIKEDYVVIHDDSSRGMNINESLIDSKYRKIRVDKSLSTNIFDYIGLLENAKEIHVIDSCFMFMIDSLNFVDNIYIHRYSRQLDQFNSPKLKNNWKII